MFWLLNSIEDDGTGEKWGEKRFEWDELIFTDTRGLKNLNDSFLFLVFFDFINGAVAFTKIGLFVSSNLIVSFLKFMNDRFNGVLSYYNG